MGPRALWSEYLEAHLGDYLDLDADLILDGFCIATRRPYVEPVPVKPIARWLGAAVKRVRPGQITNWSGALDKRQLPPIIWYVPGNRHRVRFTIAHEIGHLVLHDVHGVHLDTTYSDDDGRWMEQEANAFAADLLMPERLVYARVERHGDNIQALSEMFDVSPQAMRYRLVNVGLV